MRQTMLNSYLGTISEDESSELFDDIDKDRSGYIEINELKRVLRNQMCVQFLFLVSQGSGI